MRRFVPFLLLIVVGLAAWMLLQQGEHSPDPLPRADALLPGETPAAPAQSVAEAPAGRSAQVEAAPAFTARPLRTGSGRHGLTGIVIDESGLPVPGAWVAAYSTPVPLLDFQVDLAEILEKPLEFSLEPLTSVLADDEGRFELRGVPGRTLYLSARAFRRLTPRRQRVTPDALNQEDGVILRTAAAIDLRGKVVDHDGRPVAGAEVLISPGIKYLIAAIRQRSFFLERIYTGPDGTFHAEAVPADMPLTASGFRGAVESGIADFGPYRAGTTGRAEVRLDDLGALAGQVLDMDDAPVRDAMVVAVPLDLRRVIPFVRNPGGWSAASGSGGRFQFSELPLGSYLLLAQGRAGRSGPVSAVVGAGDSVAPPVKMDTRTVVEGRVVHADGRPAVNAVVHLQSIPGGPDQNESERFEVLVELAEEVLPEILPEATFATTDNKGRFRIPAWSRARLRVEVPGQEPLDYDLRKLDEGKRPVLVVSGTGGIEGMVVDAAARKPVPFYVVRGEARGAEKEALESVRELAEESEQTLWPRESWRTNLQASQLVDGTDGRFKLEGVPAGRWELVIQAEGYADTEVDNLIVRGGEVTRGIVVNLDRGATIMGRVLTEAAGAPVPGAYVTAGRGEESVFAAFFMGLGENLAIAETEADGTFVLSGVREKSDRINVMADGYATAMEKIEPLEAFEVREDVLVRVGLGGTVQGRVTDRHGTMLPGRMVGAFSIQARDFQQTTTDADGFYRMEHMRPGSYLLLSAALDDESLFAGDFAAMFGSSRMVPAYVAEAEITTVDIVDEAAGGCRLTGRLVQRGQPVPGAALTAFSMEATGFLNFRMSTTRTDEDGGFVFESLAPGEYTVNVDARDWDGSLPIVVPDLPEDRITLEVPRNEVRGLVISEATGAPVVKASVQLFHEDAAGGGNPFMGRANRKWSRTGEDGKFRFEGLTPGSYHLEVTQPGQQPEADGGEVLGRYQGKSFQLAFDEVRELEPVRLPAAANLEVKVLKTSGEEFSGTYTLVVRPLDPESREPAGKEIRGWGRGAAGWVRGLKPGSYSLSVQARDYVQADLDAVAVRAGQPNQVTVTLARGAELRARILSPENRPVSGAKLELLDRDGRRVNQDRGIYAAFAGMFEQDGAVEIGTFAPGSYTLRVTWNETVREQSLSLIEGRSELVEIRF